ncbi:NAD-dependent protein deacetylase sirtuin-1 [Trichomycterus rosablanca]|uniref:NAD-dependent protein deacetylase sirtuin-1 n=1 Tax=Trichomycterus rosablanca TaxID=2290929 RepID=UPI002F360935
MADLKCKLDEYDGTDEPIHKKPRNMASQNSGPKNTSGGQKNSGAESSCTVAILPRPKAAAIAIAVAQATEAVLRDESGILKPTEDATDRHLSTPETEVSGIKDDVYTGSYSPDLNDNDDCSSHASSSDWTPQPQIGSYHFIQQHLMRETDPRTILKDLLPDTAIPPDLDDMTLWQIILNISEPPKRKKRKDINTLEDVVRLLSDCKKILVLTGAGVSVSCGIPDFRSRDGIYARLAVDFPDLPDPQAMFDIDYFRRDPRPFFKFAKEIYPGQFQPSLCHRFIAMLDRKEKLLRNYTQNIDTLEQVAGVQRIIQCHGSFATASCLVCKHKVDCDSIREDIFKQVVPHCPRCPDNPIAIMKPDIVFFGENLPEVFHRTMKQDKDDVDLLIIIGSSLKVRPVALIPSSVSHEVPQVLINRETLPHLNFDVELLGDCDVIVNELCHLLGGDFEQLCCNSSRLCEITEKPLCLSSNLHTPAYVDGQTSEIQDSEKAVTGHRETVIDASEKVTVVDSSPNKMFLNDRGIKISPSLEGPSFIAASSKPLTVGQSSSCHESKVYENPPTEASGSSPYTHYKKEEDPKHKGGSTEAQKQCCFSQTCQNSISKRLEAFQYLFQSPNRYIFHGAEVYSSSEDETSSSSDSDVSCCIGDCLVEEQSDV